MNVEEQLREDLHAAPIPTALVPPADLADTLLRRARRHRRTGTTLTAVTAVVALAALGVPLALGSYGGGSGNGADGAVIAGQAKPSEAAKQPDGSAEPAFVRPGGGPQVIHVYAVEGTRTYLLDPVAGRYREVPYPVVLSPDLRHVAVDADGRTGVADRAALLRDGESAIRWIDLPPGNGPVWSPDGTALLFTSIAKGGGVRFTAHRYDLASGAVIDTPINVDILGSSVGWAADSRNYVALLRGRSTNDSVEPGALQYLKPDGTLGQRINIEGGFVGGAQAYSPSRRHVFADSSQIMSAQPVPSKILDAGTGQVVATLPPGAKPVGWYDEQTVVLLAAGSADDSVLELVDVTTGAVTKRIELPGVPQLRTIQIASSAGLTGEAVKLGF